MKEKKEELDLNRLNIIYEQTLTNVF